MVNFKTTEVSGSLSLSGDDYVDAAIDGVINIDTFEGTMAARIGDYIIKGVKGEHYPCKPDIFKQTYYTEQEYAELNQS